MRRVFAAIAGLALLAIAAAHTAPVRSLALQHISAALRTSAGIELRAASLTYNLFTLSAELRDVELAATDTPGEPFAFATAVGVRFGIGVLGGRPDIRGLSLTSPRVVVREIGNGAYNLPHIRSNSNGDAVALPDLDVDDIDVMLTVRDTTVAVEGMTAAIKIPASGAMTGSFDAKQGVRVVAAGTTYDLDAAAAVLTLDGRTLSLRDLTATGRGLSLQANGTVTFGDDEPTMDLTLNGSLDAAVAQIAEADAGLPRGRIDLRARVTGSTADPAVVFDADSQALVWPGITVDAARASGRYEDARIVLDSFATDLARGTVQGQGTLALRTGGESRVEARWSAIDARRLPGLTDEIARAVAPDGSGNLRWRAGANAGEPRRAELHVTTGVVAAGRTTALDLRARGAGDEWRIDVSPGDVAAWDFHAGGDVRLNRTRWQASTVTGRVELRARDNVRAVVERARDFGVPLGTLDPSTAAGSLDLDATFDGALDALRASGRVIGHGLTIAAAPPLDLTSSFAMDLRRRTTTGNFQAVTADLAPWQHVADPALALSGSATATGVWDGPLANPRIEVAVAGRNLGAVVAGATPIAVTGGAFDSTLEGPVDALTGRGRLVAAALDVNGRTLGEATLNLTLNGALLALDLSVPEVNATIDGTVALREPYSFSARGALAAVELPRLAARLWSSPPTATDLSGALSASFEASGDLANPDNVNAAIAIAPLDALAYGVPLRAPAGLRVTWSNGRATLDDCRVTVGAIAIRVGGDLPVGEPSGAASLDIDGDLGSLAPWLARLDADQPWTMTGRLNGALGATRTPAGVALTGSLAATVDSLVRSERVLARQTRLSVELTDSRAVVRDFTGHLLGGDLQGSFDAPLTWLNAALPEAWGIRPPASDAPAIASLKGTLDVAAALEEFAPGRLNPVSGRISLAADLSAQRPDLASIVGDIHLDQAELTSGKTTLSQAETTRFRFADGQVHVDAFHWSGPDSVLTGQGVIGLGSGARMHAQVEIDAGVNALADFLQGRGAGRVKGTVAIDGTRDDWSVTADAALADASWLVPDARVLFDGWSGTLRVEPGASALVDLSGRVNGGAVKIEGRLPLASDASDRGGLTFAAQDVLLAVPAGLHSQLGGDLTWRQGEAGSTIEGTVTITANKYSEPVTRVLALVESLARTTGGTDTVLPERLANTRLNVNLDVTDPVVIDNSASSVEILPRLRLVGTLGAPALDGEIEVADQGRIRIGGRAYQLRESRVRFAPANGLAPTLDVTGETRVGDYDVTIRIDGTPGSIETTYSSSPPLGERDLQSLIVTGRVDTPGRATNQDDFAVTAATGDILGFAGRFVGLDSVAIGSADLDLATKDASTDQHLTVSKSFGTRFEVILSDNLETSAFTWLMTWRPGAGWEVRLASVENTEDSLELRQILYFGPGVATRRAGAAADASTIVPRLVGSVAIAGTPGFPEDQLRRELHLKPGDRFVVRRWIDDRLRLHEFYQEHGYHRVRIVPTRAGAGDGPVTLRYEIHRGPKTIIETVGDELPSDAVEAMYEEWSGVPVTEVLVDRFAETARTFLARRGYPRAQVAVSFPVDTPELARAIVMVDRGPKTTRQTFTWSGNAAVSTMELDALVVAAGAQGGGFDQQALEFQVRQLYGQRGYQQVALSFGEPRFADDQVTRPVAITEGAMTRIAAVRIDGVAPARRDAATSALNLPSGTPFVASGLVDATRRLRAYYRNLGYLDAAVSPALSPQPGGDIVVALKVDEGAGHQVGAVSVSGVASTNAGLVDKAITLAPGAVASAVEAETTRRKLFEIGSFRRVDVTFALPSQEPVTTDVAIKVEEPKKYQLRYGGQLSSDQSRPPDGMGVTPGATVEFRDRNFIGRALQASVSAHYQYDFQIYGVQMSAPRVFGRLLPTTIFARDRRETDTTETASLVDRTRELSFTQRKRVSRGVELAWGYDFANRSFLLRGPADELDLGGVLTGPTASIVVDRRDSPFNPTRGWFFSSSAQVGITQLGSDLSYVRFLTRQSVYRPTGPVTLAGNVRFGRLIGYGGTPPLTIVDEFFLAGGTNSVRGYSEDALSAVTFQEVNLGGTDLVVLNGEVRYPFNRWLTGAAFVDAGNTFTSRFEIALRNLAVGTGAGVRIQTPLTSFRFDLGYPLTTGYGQRSLRFHFSIGPMF